MHSASDLTKEKYLTDWSYNLTAFVTLKLVDFDIAFVEIV